MYRGELAGGSHDTITNSTSVIQQEDSNKAISRDATSAWKSSQLNDAPASDQADDRAKKLAPDELRGNPR
jgi:hypothetical protein